ncbi:MAG: TGS domain-containing protein [Candidatus Diapherotrites archaeon]
MPQTALQQWVEALSMDDASARAIEILPKLRNGTLTLADAEKEFGKDTAQLAEAVQKIETLPQKASAEKREEAVKKILLAMSKDVRTLIVAFVDRAIELENPALENKEEKAKEALEIYAPLAHRLGMNKLKSELEDNAFEILEPEKAEEIKNALASSAEQREKELETIQKELEAKIAESGIGAKVLARSKRLYAIYKKIKKYEEKYGEKFLLHRINDVLAVRILCNSVDECYNLLGIAHALWKPLPERFDDYIAKPKPNGYKSLQTDVIGPFGKPVEIQIRTFEMHQEAENGIAAHWKYKGRERGGRMDSKLSWLKEMLEWKQDSEQAKSFMDSLKVDFFENEIFCFTPKGEVIELPEGSTPLDFAFAVHSDVGKKASGAKVNGKMVHLDFELHNGDAVEILTSEKQTPKRQWLAMVKTDKAKQKIRGILQIEAVAKPQAKEKEREIKSVQIQSAEEKDIRLAKCCTPVPGDDVIGFLTTKRKITVHRTDCENIGKFSGKHRKVKVAWNVKGKGSFEVNIEVLAGDNPGMLSELLRALTQSQVRIQSANALKETNKQVLCRFQLQTKDLKELEKIFERIQKVKGVSTVKRA